MTNLIDTSYFVANRTVAQLSQNSVRIDLTLFIKRGQKDYLNRVMGLELYKAFSDDYPGTVENPLPEKWTKLVEGAEYMYKGASYVWEGLDNSELKTSPIADYVYYQYQRDLATNVVGSGTMISNVENGEVVLNRGRMVDAWNAAREGAKNMERFLLSDPIAYPNYLGVSDHNRAYFRAINLINI